MERIRKQNGITLIALVITIIVLLILAGVAISMLSGENGILKQAADAKVETEEKSTLEQLKLAAMAATTNTKHTVDETTLNNELASSFGAKGTGYGIEKTGTTGYLVTVPATDGMQYKITTKGTVRERSIVEDITATNYGDYIIGYKDLTNITGTDKDWQVFYNDGENVWIIASDYVQVADGTAGMKTSGYYAWWNSAPSNGEKYPNGNCAQALSTSSNWIAYLDRGLAEKAMGGPTVEMFANSYNAKYKDTINKTIELDLVTTENNKGYKIKWSTDANPKNTISGVTDTKSNGMYIKTDTPDDTGRAYAYWLASASDRGNSQVMYVSYYKDVDFDMFNNSYCIGLRPVVCLKSDVQVKNTGTEEVPVWTIQK